MMKILLLLPAKRVFNAAWIIGVFFSAFMCQAVLAQEDGAFPEPEVAAVVNSEGNVFAQESNKEYTISPNDVLGVTVYEEPDLSITVRVGVNGMINYPLLGTIKAGGISISELEKTIKEMLEEDYMVNPQVSVFVKEFAKISVLGQVMRPGPYEIRDRMTISQAISLAGGFSETANASVVKLIRGAESRKGALEVNLDRIMSKEDPEVYLEAGDTIVVGEAGKYSIIGQVNRPGVFPFKRGTTVVSAIAQAGGFSDTAAQDGTRLIRVVDGQKQSFKVPVGSILRRGDQSLDIELQPDDTIVVPESFF